MALFFLAAFQCRKQRAWSALSWHWGMRQAPNEHTEWVGSQSQSSGSAAREPPCGAWKICLCNPK